MSLHPVVISDPTVPQHWIGIGRRWFRRPDSFVSELIELTPDELRKHCYVLGATGSGKSNLIHHMIAGDIVRGHSIIVLDARGDLALATADIAARSGVNPELVRFFDLGDNESPLGFNPLSGSGEPFAKALGLIDATASESASWGVQLEETFRNAALLLAETGSPITQLYALFHDRPVRLEILSRAVSANLFEYWSKYDAMTSDKQASIAAAVMNKLSILTSTSGLRTMFGHPNPVDLGAHLRTPGSITIISLAVHHLHQAGWRAGGLFLNAICREVFSQVHVAERLRNPVRLYVDEFENFDSKYFESILAEGRRFRLSLVLAHQTLAQLKNHFRSIVLGNVGAKIIFRCSHADADTLNRDISGARGTFDLPSLGIGQALLWRLGQTPRFIEVNEPIVFGSDAVSDRTRAFLAASKVGLDAPKRAESFTVGQPLVDTKPRRQSKPSMEDWLE
ncbi:MAG: type IV secretion system DNA-binding domain-containing protein [Fimbriimonadaceae bacterium]|nr:type IV secretion system DNA-binding domain-containing protein [Fimbriimonadaceae bacterium]QYK58064.1 MAG: type IV secretion system DNA-binding domain-containing protein [Fimbriimonadaceae bacterium]